MNQKFKRGWLSERARDRYHEQLKMVAAANGGGVAGVIALMNGKIPVPGALQFAGGSFIIGIILSGAAWIFAAAMEDFGSQGEQDKVEWDESFAILTHVLSGLVFLVGIIAAFLWAGGYL